MSMGIVAGGTRSGDRGSRRSTVGVSLSTRIQPSCSIWSVPAVLCSPSPASSSLTAGSSFEGGGLGGTRASFSWSTGNATRPGKTVGGGVRMSVED